MQPDSSVLNILDIAPGLSETAARQLGEILRKANGVQPNPLSKLKRKQARKALEQSEMTEAIFGTTITPSRDIYFKSIKNQPRPYTLSGHSSVYLNYSLQRLTAPGETIQLWAPIMKHDSVNRIEEAAHRPQSLGHSPDHVLGRGGFGSVSKTDWVVVYNAQTHDVAIRPMLLAIKKIKNTNKSSELDADIDKEVLLNQKIYGIGFVNRERSTTIYCAFKFLGRNTLKHFLDPRVLNHKTRAQKLYFALANLIAYQQFNRLTGYVHKDIKPSNIILGERRVYLADFGLCAPDKTGDKRAAGDNRYVSMETLYGNPQGVASDIFSFGVILGQVFGFLKFDEEFERAFRLKLVGDMRGWVPEAGADKRYTHTSIDNILRDDNKLYEFIRTMIDEDYSKRPDLETCLNFFMTESGLNNAPLETVVDVKSYALNLYHACISEQFDDGALKKAWGASHEKNREGRGQTYADILQTLKGQAYELMLSDDAEKDWAQAAKATLTKTFNNPETLNALQHPRHMRSKFIKQVKSVLANPASPKEDTRDAKTRVSQAGKFAEATGDITHSIHVMADLTSELEKEAPFGIKPNAYAHALTPSF